LLVRWAQASALMPLMQFSVGPWHFDEAAVRLSREASRMHMRFAPYIVQLAEAAFKTGEPILRPVWFNYPDDRECEAVMDEYMLGGDVLVAPVLQRGAVSRDVYLPRGRWRDDKNGKLVDGGRWLRNHPAPLETLPVFIREGSRAGQ
jgi:alpha-glucosidase (family GH31 glycosyl hydrolase)